MKWFFVLSLISLGLLPSFHAQAATTNPQVRIVNASGTTTSSFTPFSSSTKNLIGGIAAGDLGHDGVAEIIVGAGPGSPPNVTVFRQDGSQVGSFLAYGPDFTGGINVATCDIDADGLNEIITGTHFGGGPQIIIFDSFGKQKYPGFFAYDESFRGGVNVACGDVDADGQADIITGPGLTGGPHIKVFNHLGTMKYEVFNGAPTLNTGSYVSLSGSTILAAPVSDQSAITRLDLIQSKLLAASTVTTITSHNLYTTANLDHNFTITADVTSDRYNETIAQYIKVDLSEQKLTAYEYGVPINNFLVSTGVPGHPTPLGLTDVKEKLLWHDYNWSYGLNNPNNYSIPHVKYNLRIYDHIYLHYAYWHNNFGYVMSHGCININYANSEWVYNWANVGATVEIIQ
ncbi:TPA: hypothetical protein DEP96_02280 [Candidatus Uhrbacteria bacterium]|nr:hypothetical protein [Candidatus Uhrbacteria bacterium]